MTWMLLTSFYAVMAGSLAYGWFRGGRTERSAVILLIAFFLFRAVLKPLTIPQFDSVDPVALSQDLIGFVGFVWIGLSARRYWPLAAAALQLLSLSAHFARGVEDSVSGPTYAAMKAVPTLLVFILLAIGTRNYQRRKARAMLQASSPTSTSAPVGPSWARRSHSSGARATKR
ncbi:hypothetical protein ACWPMX_00020 [Tsuneonella sp. HG094]